WPDDAAADAEDEYQLRDEGDTPQPARKLAEYYRGRTPAVSPALPAVAPPSPPRHPFLSGTFTFPWYLGSLPVWIYTTSGLTVAILLLTLLYQIIYWAPTAVLALGVPVGLITCGAFSYTSVMYLHIVHQTAEGFDAIDDWPASGWTEWFWSLPSTLGVAGLAVAVGWLSRSLFFFQDSAIPLVAVPLVLYPVLQLCVLDSGSVLIPFSARILGTFATHPLAWGTFYSVTLPLGAAFCLLCQETVSDPPYGSLLFLVPLAGTLILIYGRLLGRLASRFDPEPGGRR
ncbi:MAG: hypothetical protein GTO03_13715, partial [Planctomycetales bacterium]|nr:hypothetical protein [Planctomycetales bacterium]